MSSKKARRKKKRRERLRERDGGTCHYCRRLLEVSTKSGQKDLRPSEDHVVPRSCGGPTALWNLVLACAGCNVDRGSTPHDDYCRDPACPFRGLSETFHVKKREPVLRSGVYLKP